MVINDYLLTACINKVDSEVSLSIDELYLLPDFSKKFQDVFLDISDNTIFSLYQFLNQDERNLVPKNTLLSNTFIVSRVLLKFCLARVLNTDVASINFIYGPFGKPYVNFDGVFFNTSKRKNFFSILISSRECGVDIEIPTPINIDIVSHHFFTANEQYVISQQANIRNKSLKFYDIWVRKESIIKALGGQLSDIVNFDSIEIHSPVEELTNSLQSKLITTSHISNFKDLFMATTFLPH